MFGREHGSKPGSGGLATAAETAAARKERLRMLALERIDLSKDPYFYKTHLGNYECTVCLTFHTNEASYLAHTQGKRHQTNLKARELKDARERGMTAPQEVGPRKPQLKVFKRIGTPGYSVTKHIDPATQQHSIVCTVKYPDIALGVFPMYRLMGAFEQKKEVPDRNYQSSSSPPSRMTRSPSTSPPWASKKTKKQLAGVQRGVASSSESPSIGGQPLFEKWRGGSRR